MFFLIGLAIIMLGLGFSIFLVNNGDLGPFSYFTDLPSMIAIILPLLGVLTATQSFRVFYEGLRAVISPKRELSEDMRGRAASLFRLLSKTTVLVSIINLIICLMLILKGADFGDMDVHSLIGPVLATTLITPLYGLTLITAFFEPMVFVLKKRHTGKR